jgi:hypothetical protein
MKRMEKNLLLVGSIPLPTVEDVFKKCSSVLGEHLPCIPDGEVGPRRNWVAYLVGAYKSHPDIVPEPIPENTRCDFDTRLEKTKGRYKERDRGDVHFTVRRGVSKLRLEKLGYAEPAKDSYAKFIKLRTAGVIPKDVRFQVAIPFPRSGFGNFFRKPEDFPIMEEAYEEVARRELAEITKVIPAPDLAIQWDVCGELLDVEGYWPWWPQGDKIEMNTEPAGRLGLDLLPSDVWLGYHLCYGTMGGWPMTQPKSVTSPVMLANALVRKTPRRVDFIHVPAGQKAFDASYYNDLSKLSIGDAKVYLGLIHDSDPDLSDFKKRHTAAKAVMPSFGLASVCGYGRCDQRELDHALQVHRTVIEQVARG